LPAAGEPHTKKALAFLDRWHAGEIDLVAPSLWRYEVANVLARKAPRAAAALLEGLLALDLPSIDLDATMLADALAIALRFPGASVYDAAYHALALGVGGSFVTADERYFRRTKRLGGIELLHE
jgi:predicted nucleic acid-binding protein